MEQRAERQDYKTRAPVILALARRFLSHSALVINRPWSSSEVDCTKSFLAESAHFVHPKVDPSYWEHLLLSSIYHRLLVEKVPTSKVSADEAEVMGFLHDGGRLVVPHHYYRNDLVFDIGSRALGVRQDFLDKLFPLGKVLQGKVRDRTDLTVPQMIGDVGDWLAKFNTSGTMITLPQILERSMNTYQRYPSTVWNSENWARRKQYEGARDVFNSIFLSEVDYLSTEYHLDFENLSNQVYQIYLQPENQSWLTLVKSNQASPKPLISQPE